MDSLFSVPACIRPAPRTTMTSDGRRASVTASFCPTMLLAGVTAATKNAMTTKTPRPRIIRSHVVVTSAYGTEFRGPVSAVLLRGPIKQSGNTFLLRTIGTTKQHSSLALHAVSDDPASTVVASRGQRVYCAFEAIEHMCLAGQ